MLRNHWLVDTQGCNVSNDQRTKTQMYQKYQEKNGQLLQSA